MIAVLVENPPGGRRGRDVVEPLAVTEQVAAAKGRAELARESSDRMLVSLAAAGPWCDPGVVVSMTDPEGGARRGMVRGCALRVARTDDEVTLDVTLDIEVEA